MYNHNYNVSDQTSGYFSQFDPSNLSTMFTQSLTCNFDSTHETMLENRNGSTSTMSGTSSYIGSPGSPISSTSGHPPHNMTTLFQRSPSSHCLNKDLHPLFSYPSTGISSFDLGSVRRVSSTGDLDQGMLCNRSHLGGSPPANESTSIILEGMMKPCRYSPEEKKERIEKYRSKRSQRNFNKKIQYACRKTLADSRPRVRGRFARNDELEKPDCSQDIHWTQMAGEEDEEDGEQWIHLLDSISPDFVP